MAESSFETQTQNTDLDPPFAVYVYVLCVTCYASAFFGVSFSMALAFYNRGFYGDLPGYKGMHLLTDYEGTTGWAGTTTYLLEGHI